MLSSEDGPDCRPLLPSATHPFSASLPAIRQAIPSACDNQLAASLPNFRTLTTLNYEALDLYTHVVKHSDRESEAGRAAHTGKMSLPTTIMTFMKVMLGPMLLYAPRMYAEAGLLLAMAMFLLTGYLSTVGMLLLVAVHDSVIDKIQGSSNGAFAEIGRLAVGSAGFFMVESCLAVSQWLYCVGYPIFVARNMQQVLASIMLVAPSKFSLLATQLPFLVVYCWIRDIHRLGLAMLVANLCLWGSVLAVFTLVIMKLIENGSNHTPAIELVRLGPGTLFFTAQAVVAFEGIALVLPIREAMREPSRFREVVFGCMSTGTLALVLTGVGAYLAFGESTATFVTLNLEGAAAACVRGAFSLSVVLTYPLQLFPAMQALEASLGLSGSEVVKNRPGSCVMQLMLQCLARTGLVCAAFLFALYAPYDNLVALAGGLCAVPLAFIFPGWFYLCLCPGRNKVARIHAIFISVFGAIMAPVAVAAAIVSWK